MLDAHIRRIEKPRPPDGLWHPSSLFGCARQAVYEIRGVPQSDQRDGRSRRILRLGTTVHEIVQEAFIHESGAKAVYNEVAVDIPVLGVTGHCDTLLEYEDFSDFDDDEIAGNPIPDDDYELLEFKSIGVNGFRYLSGPKPDHESQARAYLYGLREYGGHVAGPLCFDDEGGVHDMDCVLLPPLGDKLGRGRIAYFSRDDLRIEEFVFEHDPDWDEKFLADIAHLDTFRGGNALPPRLPLEEGKRNWLCADYCLWRTRCWNQDAEGEQL